MRALGMSPGRRFFGQKQSPNVHVVCRFPFRPWTKTMLLQSQPCHVQRGVEFLTPQLRPVDGAKASRSQSSL